MGRSLRVTERLGLGGRPRRTSDILPFRGWGAREEERRGSPTPLSLPPLRAPTFGLGSLVPRRAGAGMGPQVSGRALASGTKRPTPAAAPAPAAPPAAWTSEAGVWPLELPTVRGARSVPRAPGPHPPGSRATAHSECDGAVLTHRHGLAGRGGGARPPARTCSCRTGSAGQGAGRLPP